MASLWDRVKRAGSARSKGESDAPVDGQTAFSREAGGEKPSHDTQDQNSSTGTTPNAEPVGRASGDETADAGESGGDRRGGRPADAHDGALRDE